jgi:hypothetical protein
VNLAEVLDELRHEQQRLTGLIEYLEQNGALPVPHTPLSTKAFPEIAPGIEWSDLTGLSNRILSRLAKKYDRPGRLAHVRASDLLEIRGFGAKSLTDLIAAIAAHAPSGERRGAQEQPARSRREAERLARAIRNDPAAKHLSARDLRFGVALRMLDPQARDAGQVADRLLRRPAEMAHLTSSLRELYRAIQSAKTLTLESELQMFLGFLKKPRDREVFARVHGWDGQGGTILEEAGRRCGLTRERARQMCAPLIEALRGPQFVPALDRALAFLQDHLGRPAAEVEADLQAAGVTSGPFRVEGILKAAAVFRRETDLVVRTHDGCRLLKTNLSPNKRTNVIAHARRLMRREGILQISGLASQVSKLQGYEISDGFVREILEAQKDFRWLDQAGGWFWLAAYPQNPLVVRLRKALSVAARINARDLPAALSKRSRAHASVLPVPVLLALCRELPWCRVNEQHVEAIEVPDASILLSKTEQIVCRILQLNGGTLTVDRLEQDCRKAGVGKASVWSAIGSS